MILKKIPLFAQIEKSWLNKISSGEIFLWLLIAPLFSGGFLLDIYNNHYDFDFQTRLRRHDLPIPVIGELIKNHYSSILVSILVLIFPLVFRQIFGKLPFQSWRESAGSSKKNVVVHGSGNVIHFEKEEEKEKRDDRESQFHNQINEFELNEIQLLNKYVDNSTVLSNKIYIRSGVYLMFGVLIAFGGILYFSFQSIPTPQTVTTNQTISTPQVNTATQSITSPSSTDTVHNLILLAPKFGILFFIEFIAFFFLKQYRAAMDEFRHYDSIKRNRESQLAIFLIATKTFKEKKFVTVIDKMSFFAKVDKLSAGETTELLESYRANKSEFEIFKDAAFNGAKSVKKAVKMPATQ